MATINRTAVSISPKPMALKLNQNRKNTMLTDNDRAEQMGQATRDKLKQFVTRIERLEAEKTELAADIREVYTEVKVFGLDTKIMRKVIALRKQEAAERAEQEALTEMYLEVVEG